MDIEQARSYRAEQRELLAIGDSIDRKTYLAGIRNTPEYQEAKRLRIQERQQFLAVREAVRPALPVSEERLDPEAEIINWAISVHPSNSSSDSLDRETIRNNHTMVVRRLVEEPQVLPKTLEVWRSLEPEGDSNPFSREIISTARNFLEKKWQEMSPAMLAELVRVAAHSETAGEDAKDLLRAYFRGPKGPVQVTDALYSFAFSLLDLIEDRKSLGLGSQTLKFQSDILRLGSKTYKEYMAMLFLGVDNLKALQKASSLDSAASTFAYLAGLDIELLTVTASDYSIKLFKPNLDPILAKYAREAVGRVGNSLFTRRLKETDRMRIRRAENGSRRLSPEAVDALVDEFEMGQCILYPETELIDRMQQGGSRSAITVKTAERVLDDLRPSFVDRIPILKTISLSEPDYWVTMLVPALPDIASLEQRILDSREDRARDIQTIETGRPGRTVIKTTDDVVNSDSPFFVHKIDSSLGLQHDLFELERNGFPLFRAGNWRELVILNDQIADNATGHHQRIFLTAGGIQVPLTSWGIFKDLGYQRIIFRKIVSGTQAVIEGEDGLSVQVKFDRALNLDLEGRPYFQPLVAESFRYSCLKILEYVLTRDPQGGGTSTDSKGILQIVRRMPYFRYLTGKNHTDRAVGLCRDYVGKHLPTESDARQSLDPKGLNRPSTFVKPIEREDDNTEPTEIDLAGKIEF